MSSFMANKNLLKLLKYCVQYAHFFKVIPCKWNFENSEIEHIPTDNQNPKWSFKHQLIKNLHWDFKYSRLMFLIYFTYILVRFPNTLVTFNIKNMRTFMMELVLLLAFSFTIVVQFAWAQHGPKLVHFTNNSLKYSKYLEETYPKRFGTNEVSVKNKNPHWQLECLGVVIIFFQGSIFTPLLIFLTFIQRPDMPCFITGLLFSNLSELPLYLRVLFGLHIFWAFLSTWACLLCTAYMIFLPIYGSIFLLGELRPMRKSEFTSDELRFPNNMKNCYQVIHLLFTLLNSITQDYVFMFANDVCITFSVWSNYFLICGHDKLGIESIVVASICSFFPSGYLIVSYLKLGQLNQKSKELIAAWKRYGKTIMRRKFVGEDRNDFNIGDETPSYPKWLRSCRRVQIELGTFGHYQRPTSIRIIGKLLVYTVRFILTMSKIFPV